MEDTCNNHSKITKSIVFLFRRLFPLNRRVELSLRMLCFILAVNPFEVLLIEVLATRGVIAVDQSEAYGDISLAMLV
jgi:hypothetical protein